MDKQVRKLNQREVADLGEAAFAKMKGFRCVGRKGRSFFFDVPVGAEEKFDALNLEYINSPYHDFDACIMSMKKVADRLSEPRGQLRKAVSDLGSAAYLKMHGFKCAGRRGRNFFFEVADEDVEKFDMLNFEYVNSQYHDFDSAIMCLKKIGEYMAE
jgi:hypothetical protein